MQKIGILVFSSMHCILEIPSLNTFTNGSIQLEHRIATPPYPLWHFVKMKSSSPVLTVLPVPQYFWLTSFNSDNSWSNNQCSWRSSISILLRWWCRKGPIVLIFLQLKDKKLTFFVSTAPALSLHSFVVYWIYR